MNTKYLFPLLISLAIMTFSLFSSAAAEEMENAIDKDELNNSKRTVQECIGQEIKELPKKARVRVISNDGENVAYVKIVKTRQRICVRINDRLRTRYRRSLTRTLVHELKPNEGASFVNDAPTPIWGSNYAINLNPGGLRGSRGPFTYATLEEGVRAMDELLGRYYFSNPMYNTINKYVSTYVGPVGRRRIEEYKRNISAWSGVPRDQVIGVDDRETRNLLLAAALRQESGGDWNGYIAILFALPLHVAETEE